jgi:hypothetical protein
VSRTGRPRSLARMAKVEMIFEALAAAAAAGAQRPKREELSRLTGLTDAAVSNAICELVEAGRVRHIGTSHRWPVIEIVATGERTAARPERPQPAPKVREAASVRAALPNSVLRLLTEAADAGAPCPSNNAMAEKLLCEPTSVATAVRQLADRKLIAVDFTGLHKRSGRFVTIAATGARTAPAKMSPRVLGLGEPVQRSDLHRKEYVPVAERRAQSYVPPALGAEVLPLLEVEDRELADHIQVESLRLGVPRAKLIRDLLFMGFEVHLDNDPAAQARGARFMARSGLALKAVGHA